LPATPHREALVLRVGFARRFRADSDVDVLVDFEAGKTPGLAIVEIVDELKVLLGRDVDLVTVPGLRNPFIRYEILRTRQLAYAA
jgi:uncharacterized protein